MYYMSHVSRKLEEKDKAIVDASVKIYSVLGIMSGNRRF